MGSPWLSRGVGLRLRTLPGTFLSCSQRGQAWGPWGGTPPRPQSLPVAPPPQRKACGRGGFARGTNHLPAHSLCQFLPKNRAQIWPKAIVGGGQEEFRVKGPEGGRAESRYLALCPQANGAQPWAPGLQKILGQGQAGRGPPCRCAWRASRHGDGGPARARLGRRHLVPSLLKDETACSWGARAGLQPAGSLPGHLGKGQRAVRHSEGSEARRCPVLPRPAALPLLRAWRRSRQLWGPALKGWPLSVVTSLAPPPLAQTCFSEPRGVGVGPTCPVRGLAVAAPGLTGPQAAQSQVSGDTGPTRIPGKAPWPL